MSKGGKRDKKLDKLTEEVCKICEKVSYEREVPGYEASVAAALKVFAERDNADTDKVKAFEKRQRAIINKDDPKERIEQCHQLRQDIIKADLLEREKDFPGSTWANSRTTISEQRPLRSARSPASAGRSSSTSTTTAPASWCR